MYFEKHTQPADKLSVMDEVLVTYYEQENKRRTEWLEEIMKELTPEPLYNAYKTGNEGAEDMMRAWFKEEEYRIEVSEDGILIQVWKGKEQVAQYQTILPQFVQLIDCNYPKNLRNN